MPKRMIEKSSSSSSSSIKALPVEIETEIINKILDLKTLCLIKGACKRFREIASQVETIVYTCKGEDEFELAMASLLTFTSLKFMRIVVPDDNQPTLYKWKIASFGNSRKIDSFVFLSLDSKNHETNDYSHDQIGGGELDLLDLYVKYMLATDCLEDAVRRHKMMLSCIKDELPLLQIVSITDPDNRGRVTAGEEEISRIRKLDDQRDAETMVQQVPSGFFDDAWSLKLPVSGQVVKGVYILFVGSADGFKKFRDDDIGGSADEEEMIYNEAIKEMLQNGNFDDISDEFLECLIDLLNY